MTNPSARVQLIQSPQASPGNCGMCGKAQHDEGFLDLQLDFEYYGVLYFCKDCVGDMARAFGFVSPNVIVELRQRIDEQNNELITQRASLLNLESTVDNLIADAHRRNQRKPEPVTSDPSNDAGNEPVVEQPSLFEQEPAAEEVGAGTESQPAVTEPALKQGPNDVLGTQPSPLGI